MKLFKILMVILIIITLVIGGCIFYAFKIEPYQLVLNQIKLNKQQNNSLHLKVIQISDLHIKEDFTYKELEKVVDKINKQEPDIVVFTGDLYDNFSKYQDNPNVIKELGKIKAKYDKIAIWGNRDYGGGAVRMYEEIMNQSGFTLLTNESLVVPLSNNRSILFTGLDDSLLGNPELDASIDTAQGDYKILLTHEPDAIETYNNDKFNIILSGHSHGGQINIPFLDFINEEAISNTALSSNYNGGMYQLENKQKLYVNTGIGTTHISARFNVTPEIVVFHIYI